MHGLAGRREPVSSGAKGAGGEAPAVASRPFSMPPGYWQHYGIDAAGKKQPSGAPPTSAAEDKQADEPGPREPGSPAAPQAKPGQAAAEKPDQAQAGVTAQGHKAPPTITTETSFPAPDGSGKARTSVGVGEAVTFTGSAAGTWKASSGKPVTGASGAKFGWTAPSRADSVTIELTVDTQKTSVTLQVVEPDGITGIDKHELTFPAGTQGAGMTLKFKYSPFNVSFGNVSAKEVSGPASSRWGYYANPATTGDLKHDSGDTFTAIGQNNIDTAPDTSSFQGADKPWTAGGWDWLIPNHFRVNTETGDGKKFTTVTQNFVMKGPPNAGESTVNKAGQSANRKP